MHFHRQGNISHRSTPTDVFNIPVRSHLCLISSQRLVSTHRLLILLCWPPHLLKKGEKSSRWPLHTSGTGACHNSLSSTLQISQNYFRSWSPSTSQSFMHQEYDPLMRTVAINCKTTMSWPQASCWDYPVLPIQESTRLLSWGCGSSWNWAQSRVASNFVVAVHRCPASIPIQTQVTAFFWKLTSITYPHCPMQVLAISILTTEATSHAVICCLCSSLPLSQPRSHHPLAGKQNVWLFWSCWDWTSLPVRQWLSQSQFLLKLRPHQSLPNSLKIFQIWCWHTLEPCSSSSTCTYSDT